VEVLQAKIIGMFQAAFAVTERGYRQDKTLRAGEIGNHLGRDTRCQWLVGRKYNNLARRFADSILMCRTL
jgi:hypothetical protein